MLLLDGHIGALHVELVGEALVRPLADVDLLLDLVVLGHLSEQLTLLALERPKRFASLRHPLLGVLKDYLALQLFILLFVQLVLQATRRMLQTVVEDLVLILQLAELRLGVLFLGHTHDRVARKHPRLRHLVVDVAVGEVVLCFRHTGALLGLWPVAPTHRVLAGIYARALNAHRPCFGLLEHLIQRDDRLW